jgi:type I restriction enzyme S subunit
MDTQTFLDNFGAIADAPGGVDRLRELVLHLALEGKLVRADAADEPVSALLARLDQESERTMTERAFRKQRMEPSVRPDELPGCVPCHWSWLRLADIAHPQAGFAFKSGGFNETGRGMPLIRIRDIGTGETECFFDGDFRDEFVVNHGDFLIGMDGNFNIRRWSGDRALLNQRVTRLVFFGDEIAQQFVVWALQREINKLHGSRAYTTVQHLSGKQIANSLIPVPPIEEQHRIVEKADELMRLCDHLEARQQAQQSITARLRASSLDALTKAEPDYGLQSAWSRVHSNWESLMDEVEGVGAIRQAILQIAVKGRLVAQCGDDEPASALVKHCAEARGAIVAAGGSRRRRDLTATATDLFDLPGGWAWVRIDDCFEVTGGIQKSGKRRPIANSHPYLRVANVQRGHLDLSELERFELFDGELERHRLHRGDLLVVEGNGSQSEIGRCARWDGEIEDCVHQNHLIRCRPLTHGLEAFALLYMNSPAGMEIMTRLAVTTSGLYNLSVSKIRSIPMPLPPGAEQRRIIQRVEELMSLCDGLEVSLRARTETAEVLAAGLTQVVSA